MQKKLYRIVELSIIVILLFLAGVLFIPAYKAAAKKMETAKNACVRMIREKTGLEISCASVSPSILKRAGLHDVTITDSFTGTQICSVKKIYAYYNPVSFLSDMPWKAVTRIVIEDGNAVFDIQNHEQLIAKLRSLSSSNDESHNTNIDSRQNVVNDALEISVRSVSLKCSTPTVSAGVLIKKTKLSVSPDSIKIDFFSDVELEGLPAVTTCSTSLHLTGDIASDFSDGTALISFERNTFPYFSLSDFSFLLTLSDSTVDIRTSQSVMPVDFHLSADFLQKTASLTMAAELWKPFNFVRTSADLPPFLTSSTVTGTLSANIDDTQAIAYVCDISADLPELYRPSELTTISCALHGTQNEINITRLAALSDSVQAEFSGLFIYEPPESNKPRAQSVFPFLPEGKLTVSKLRCPDNSIGTADLYLNPYRNGFMLFSPAIAIDTVLFSDCELIVEPSAENIDFSFSCKNYAAEQGGLDGSVSVDGSFLMGEKPYLQFFVGIDTLMLNPVSRFISAFTQNTSSGQSDAATFAVTTELYAATDFDHILFNSPRFILAGLEDNDLYALFSVAGSDRSIDFTDITVSAGSNTVQGSIHTQIDTDFSFLFNTDIVFNSVPYTASGMYSPSGDFNVYGDYGLSIIGSAADNFSRINARMMVADFPVVLAGFTFSAGLDAGFSYQKNAAWRLSFNSISVAEISGRLPSMPQFLASGMCDKNGLFIDTLSLSDTFSSLTGMCSVNWNLNDANRFIECMMTLNSEHMEQIQFNGVLSNASSSDFFTADDMFLSIQTSVQNFFAGHIFENQQQENQISFTASASGTLINNYISLDSPSFMFSVNDMPVSGRISAAAADNVVHVQNSVVSIGAHSFSDISLSYEVDNALAELSAAYAGIVMGNGISTAASVSISGISGLRGTIVSAVPELLRNFSADVVLTKNTINGEAGLDEISALIVRLPDQVLFTVGEDAWLQGSIGENGLVSVDAKAPFPAEFSLSGNLNPDNFGVSVSDAVLDFPNIWKFLDISKVSFETGVIAGNFDIGGSIQDPEFSGSLQGTDISLRLPDFVQGQTAPFTAQIAAESNHIIISGDDIGYGTGSVSCAVDIEFDRWKLFDVNISVQTKNDTRLPADLQIYMAHIKGAASGSLDIKVNSDRLYLGGALKLENGFVCLSNDFSSLNEQSDSSFAFMSDFSVAVGNHVEFLFPSERMPILQAVVTAAEPISILVDGNQQTFSVKGSADMRGGQIFYVKRNFYLRDGFIEINANQNLFDPIVSFQAEIRERDTENKPVSIILAARRQFLSQLSPVLSSSPPKSEIEIRTLLGHAAFVDAVTGGSGQNVSVKELMLSASDVFTQFLFFRQFENFMRETLHLDSFSIRSQLLQNIINTASSDQTKQRLGNYFDNTSVYVGKYVVSDLYLDGMFHLYYDKTSSPTDPWGGLRLQLESGFEIASPFCNIRFNYRPEFDKISETLGIPDASVTLSWKFDF